MANDWYTADRAHVLKSKEMALWRNADAKLVSAGVGFIDDLIAFSLTEPISIATPRVAASYIPKYSTTQYRIGRYTEISRLVTAQNLYPAMGICSTTEATPNIHAISVRTGAAAQSTINMGRHVERENPTAAEAERIDILGMLMASFHAECSNTLPEAVQTTDWVTAFTKSTSTDDIAPANRTEEPYKWEHFTFSGFTYNSEPIKADIIGWAFDVINTITWTGLDSIRRYSIGKYLPFTQPITTIEINPYGHNAFELIRKRLEDYLTDLDLVVKCARNVTTDYIQWTHDKVYCQPFTIAASKTSGGVERYFLRLFQLDTGSLAIEAKDAYNNDFYENP